MHFIRYKHQMTDTNQIISSSHSLFLYMMLFKPQFHAQSYFILHTPPFLSRLLYSSLPISLLMSQLQYPIFLNRKLSPPPLLSPLHSHSRSPYIPHIPKPSSPLHSPFSLPIHPTYPLRPARVCYNLLLSSYSTVGDNYENPTFQNNNLYLSYATILGIVIVIIFCGRGGGSFINVVQMMYQCPSPVLLRTTP